MHSGKVGVHFECSHPFLHNIRRSLGRDLNILLELNSFAMASKSAKAEHHGAAEKSGSERGGRVDAPPPAPLAVTGSAATTASEKRETAPAAPVPARNSGNAEQSEQQKQQEQQQKSHSASTNNNTTSTPTATNTSVHNNDNDAPLSPPPERVFSSRAEAIEYAKTWARNHRYGVVIRRSTRHKGKGQRSTVYMNCDRGGVPRRSNNNNKNSNNSNDNNNAAETNNNDNDNVSSNKGKDESGSGSASAPPAKRQRRTRKIGCPFLLLIRTKTGSDWVVSVPEARHNHEANTVVTTAGSSSAGGSSKDTGK